MSYELARSLWTGRGANSLVVGANNLTPQVSESYPWFLKVDIKDSKPNTISLLVCDGGDLYLHQQETLETSTGEGLIDFGLRSAYIQLEKGGKIHPILSDEEFQDYEAWPCCFDVEVAETYVDR